MAHPRTVVFCLWSQILNSWPALSQLKLPPCMTNNGEITPRWTKEVNQGQLGSMPVHPMDRDGLQWIDMDGFGCHWIILDLEGGYLTQMVHHGITKLEIDVCGLQLTQSLFHQQPWPSICISHTASLSMHTSKEVPCVLCNVYIVQTKQELSSRIRSKASLKVQEKSRSSC